MSCSELSTQMKMAKGYSPSSLARPTSPPHLVLSDSLAFLPCSSHTLISGILSTQCPQPLVTLDASLSLLQLSLLPAEDPSLFDLGNSSSSLSAQTVHF